MSFIVLKNEDLNAVASIDSHHIGLSAGDRKRWFNLDLFFKTNIYHIFGKYNYSTSYRISQLYTKFL